MLNKRKRGDHERGSRDDDNSSDEENFERNSKQSASSSHYTRREQVNDESSSSDDMSDLEDDEIDQELVQEMAGRLMNDFSQFNRDLMLNFHMLAERMVGRGMEVHEILCFSESASIPTKEELSGRIVEGIENSFDFLKVCALTIPHPPVHVSEDLSKIIYGGDSLETCKSRLSKDHLDMINEKLRSPEYDMKLLVRQQCIVAWPLFENEQVLLLSGSEESRNEMIQLFAEKKVTVIDDDNLDNVVLSRSIVVVSDDFIEVKKPFQLSTYEKTILEFAVQIDCILFKHLKYCFEHCIIMEKEMFDECSELLKKNNYFSGLLQFPLYQHRKRRRNLLDEDQIQSFKEAASSLPDINEQISLTRLVPNEIIYHILRFLQVQELLEFRVVNNLANVMCLQNFIWKDMCVNTCKKYPFFSSMNIDAYNLPYVVVYRNYIRPLIKDFSKLLSLCHIEDSTLATIVSKERFLQLLTPTLFIDTSICSDEEIPIGSSKMGGTADLPTTQEGTEVKEIAGKISQMGLLLQLNLNECVHEIFGLSYQASNNLLKNIFPKSGILYFFCHTSIESPHGIILHYDGPMDKLKRCESGKEKNAFRIKFYEALSLPAVSDCYFTSDYKKYGDAIRGVDEDDLFDILSQHIHAPFSQGEPHSLFGRLPFVTQDEWIRDENDLPDSDEDEDEEDDRFLDMNKILTPILKLSSDCKTEEDQMFRRVFGHTPIQEFLQSGESISFSIDRDCKWKTVKDFGDGSSIRQLSCFVDDLFDEVSEPLHHKYKKKVKPLFFKPGPFQ
ncbi:hypothetical protein C9374_006046 [Naegleria lovaniensis]|uniref:F-box domain-containing protein n=1 Tax=Naegleria lovaniensis TaxID=51637 RepID=A0AA88KHZ3_NAELO|nr:uncharacterized protein C9374_006046 [Naegleria lovaniensis]KAG2381662.1 hypothetical protein C9374_006046 [Naegleria lovaniensis]